MCSITPESVKISSFQDRMCRCLLFVPPLPINPNTCIYTDQCKLVMYYSVTSVVVRVRVSLLHMPGFPGSSLGSGGWGLRCQELMRSRFFFVVVVVFSYVFDFLGLLGFSPCIYMYVYIHSSICIHIYFVLPFCAAPSLSPPWLTLSVRWGDTCAFGCLVSWGRGQGSQG